MRILVTGGCGKLGRWVVRELVSSHDADGQGRTAHDVTVLESTIREPVDGVTYVEGDILDVECLLEATRGMDVVVHLAGIPRPSMAPEPVIFATNVLGTFNVHESALLNGVARVVSASSAAVLGWTYRDRDISFDYLPVDEDHPVHPQGAYALSKHLGEQIARSYSERSDLCTVALRPNWVAEPEQLAALYDHGGRPAASHDLFAYVDVRDLAVAFRLAAEVPLSGHHVIYTNADDSSTQVPLSEAFRAAAPSVAFPEAPPSLEALISNARAQRLLGWKPAHTWREHGGSSATRAI
jgi:nucleoside-diphosphate-sugar epimerase